MPAPFPLHWLATGLLRGVSPRTEHGPASHSSLPPTPRRLEKPKRQRPLASAWCQAGGYARPISTFPRSHMRERFYFKFPSCIRLFPVMVPDSWLFRRPGGCCGLPRSAAFRAMGNELSQSAVSPLPVRKLRKLFRTCLQADAQLCGAVQMWRKQPLGASHTE